MAGLLRRKDHYDEMLGALNPNIELPTRIASQIVDSQYFTRFIGEDLAMGHDARRAAEDHERAVQNAAADTGAPVGAPVWLVARGEPFLPVFPYPQNAESDFPPSP